MIVRMAIGMRLAVLSLLSAHPTDCSRFPKEPHHVRYTACYTTRHRRSSTSPRSTRSTAASSKLSYSRRRPSPRSTSR